MKQKIKSDIRLEASKYYNDGLDLYVELYGETDLDPENIGNSIYKAFVDGYCIAKSEIEVKTIRYKLKRLWSKLIVKFTYNRILKEYGL